jgi:hypothetical protein
MSYLFYYRSDVRGTTGVQSTTSGKCATRRGIRLRGRTSAAGGRSGRAWTWAGIPNRFGDSLESLKLTTDLHFVSGINGIIGLSYSYAPMKLGAPSWMPYFGPVVYGERFPPGSEWTAVREPFPSGLLGPARLVCAKQSTTA